MTKKTPIGVRLISILYYIFVALLLISSLGFLFGGEAVQQSIAIYLPNLVLNLGAMIGIGLGIIILAGIVFYIGQSLSKGKRWAKNTVLIIASILAIVEIISIFSSAGLLTGWIAITKSIVVILINAGIVWYLISNKRGKLFFS